MQICKQIKYNVAVLFYNKAKIMCGSGKMAEKSNNTIFTMIIIEGLFSVIITTIFPLYCLETFFYKSIVMVGDKNKKNSRIT